MIRHKFKAIPTELDGIKFASKKEAKRYRELEMLKKADALLFFLRQVPFHLSGNVKYVCDFLCFWKDGTVTIEDVKGIKTPIYVLKKKQVEATYPIKITEI
jgi:dsDNA-binding SOS-regulon protein